MQELMIKIFFPKSFSLNNYKYIKLKKKQFSITTKVFRL
jgi:hypothetical protein